VQQSADAMTAEPLRSTVKITNEQGLHMRPLGAFVKLASGFQSSVSVCKDGQPPVDGRSMFGLMSLGAEQGTELVLEVSGPDQEPALQALVGFLANLAHEEDEAPLDAP
jgi:phosphocarrier protein